MAARQHLYALQDEGLVVANSRKEGVGRPVKEWQLTDAADAFFPHGYADLTAGLLGDIRKVYGEDGMARIVAERSVSQISSYRAGLTAAITLEDKLHRLAEIRTVEGYMAEMIEDDDGYAFVENHCPIRVAARACTGLCDSELEVFEAVLGPKVSIVRDEHILAGHRRCAYRVSEVAT